MTHRPQILPAFGDDVVARPARRSRTILPRSTCRLRHGHDCHRFWPQRPMIVMPSRCLFPGPCAPASIARISRDTAIRAGIWLPACFATMPGAAMSPCISAASKTRHCRCPAPVLHARLNVDLPGHRRLEPAAVRGEANRALRFFNFVKAELGRFDLSPGRSASRRPLCRSLRPPGCVRLQLQICCA
jgi:hypothetical protein